MSVYHQQKNVSTFMYHQILHRDRKHTCRYCLQSFSIAQILERHVNGAFENQMIKMAKKREKQNMNNKKKHKMTIHK